LRASTLVTKLCSGRTNAAGITSEPKSTSDTPRQVRPGPDAKLLGHPVHQMLIVLPVGLLLTAFIFDVVGSATGNPE
jgi:hypothetical protein